MGEKRDQGGRRGDPENRRQQLVLSQLQRHESMTLRDLAEQIAVTDQGRSIESLSEEAIEEVEIALHHVHAPKLDTAGYVEYDSRNRVVGLTERGRRLRIDVECDGDVDQSDRITVDLCCETIDLLHELIRNDERFGARMSYDAIINTALSDLDSVETEAEERGEAR